MRIECLHDPNRQVFTVFVVHAGEIAVLRQYQNVLPGDVKLLVQEEADYAAADPQCPIPIEVLMVRSKLIPVVHGSIFARLVDWWDGLGRDKQAEGEINRAFATAGAAPAIPVTDTEREIIKRQAEHVKEAQAEREQRARIEAPIFGSLHDVRVPSQRHMEDEP